MSVFKGCIRPTFSVRFPTEAHCLFRRLPLHEFRQRADGILDNQVFNAVLPPPGTSFSGSVSRNSNGACFSGLPVGRAHHKCSV